ncbi:MAG: DHH family phosphoesterase [Candidatus Micrarchaeota archaeon]
MPSANEFFRRNENARVLITFHSLGDVDAVGSAFALKSFFKNSLVYAPDPVNAQAKKLMRYLGAGFDEFPQDCGALIILDTNSRGLLPQLGRLENFSDVMILDHHTVHPDSIHARTEMIDPSYSSTAEIVYELLKELNYEVADSVAVCLLCGIISDSANFQNANTKTFKYVGELLEKTRMDYKEVLALTETPMNISERIAILKACQRAQLTRVGDFLIVASMVSAFESAAASSFLMLGADFAFVGYEGEDARISARMRTELAKTGVDLADIMSRVAGMIGGSGGGHPCAAGANGPNTNKVEEALADCVRLVKEKLVEYGVKV